MQSLQRLICENVRESANAYFELTTTEICNWPSQKINEVKMKEFIKQKFNIKMSFALIDIKPMIKFDLVLNPRLNHLLFVIPELQRYLSK
jgi:hypothetical protein